MAGTVLDAPDVLSVRSMRIITARPAACNTDQAQGGGGPVNRSIGGYNRPDSPALMRLAHPTHIRLTPEQLQALDRWRGNRMSRATAIRLLLDQSLQLHTRGILPATSIANDN